MYLPNITSTLHAGFEFGSPDNQRLVSPNGKFEAVFQTDGNFCVYPIAGQRCPSSCLFATNTCGFGSKRFVMQKDGNIVIYNTHGSPIWSSDTYFDVLFPETSRLILQDSGTLAIYTNHGLLWDTLGTRNFHTPTDTSSLENCTLEKHLRGKQDTLHAGAEIILSSNQRLTSPNGEYDAVFERDGNFRVYKIDSQKRFVNEIYQTGTTGKNAHKIIMQKDGNLVIYDRNHYPIWSSDTHYDVLFPESSRLVMQDDGNLVIYTKHGPLWDIYGSRYYQKVESTTLPPLRQKQLDQQQDTLYAGTYLSSSSAYQSLVSNNKMYEAVFRQDGNFCVYPFDSQRTVDDQLFSTGTFGRNAGRLVMQEDGNLVIYDVNNFPIWASNTMNHAEFPESSRLIMQNDGNLVLYTEDGPVWDMHGRHYLQEQDDLDYDEKLDFDNDKLSQLKIGSQDRDTLHAGCTLEPMDKGLVSPNGKFEAIFQKDGNFCVYPTDGNRSPHTCLFATSTWGMNSRRFVMQADGNLVVYDSNGKPIWSSDTYYNVLHPTSSRLVMQDDGNLVIYTDHGPLWDMGGARYFHQG